MSIFLNKLTTDGHSITVPFKLKCNGTFESVRRHLVLSSNKSPYCNDEDAAHTPAHLQPLQWIP